MLGRGERAERHDGRPAIDQAYGGELVAGLDVGDPCGNVSVGRLRQALGRQPRSPLAGRLARPPADAVLKLGAAEHQVRFTHADARLHVDLGDRGA